MAIDLRRRKKSSSAAGAPSHEPFTALVPAEQTGPFGSVLDNPSLAAGYARLQALRDEVKRLNIAERELAAQRIQDTLDQSHIAEMTSRFLDTDDPATVEASDIVTSGTIEADLGALRLRRAAAQEAIAQEEARLSGPWRAAEERIHAAARAEHERLAQRVIDAALELAAADRAYVAFAQSVTGPEILGGTHRLLPVTSFLDALRRNFAECLHHWVSILHTYGYDLDSPTRHSQHGRVIDRAA